MTALFHTTMWTWNLYISVDTITIISKFVYTHSLSSLGSCGPDQRQVVILNHLVKKTNQNIMITIFLQFPAKGTQITLHLYTLQLIIIKFRLSDNMPPKAIIAS